MTDDEAKMRLLKIIYEFEAAGLCFASLLERPRAAVPTERLLASPKT